MWFDNAIIEADTTEDQSGVSFNKVMTFNYSVHLDSIGRVYFVCIKIFLLQFTPQKGKPNQNAVKAVPCL